MQEPVILSAARTAIGAFGGAFRTVGAIDLGATVVAEAIRRAHLAPDQVTDVVMGNVLQAGLGQHPARQCALKAGCAPTVNAFTVSKVCGSGLMAVALAAQAIRVGDADVVVAGGTESMSQAPFLLDQARFGYRLGDGKLTDIILRDGLTDANSAFHMGMAAESIGQRHGISRQEQDAFALQSQSKHAQAAQQRAFVDEIVPLRLPQRKGEPLVIDADEHPRPKTTLEDLARLKPAFCADGAVTAGNASGINDGAAAVVLASRSFANRLGIEPLAEIVAYASAGVGPDELDRGAALAAQLAMRKAGLDVEQVDLVEINEAFAVQTLAASRLLGCDAERLNVHGGAIAMGHPIGASGARILVTLLHAMRRRDSRCGVATLCIGGGEGVALVVRR